LSISRADRIALLAKDVLALRSRMDQALCRPALRNGSGVRTRSLLDDEPLFPKRVIEESPTTGELLEVLTKSK
jgi:hypothetical protein